MLIAPYSNMLYNPECPQSLILPAQHEPMQQNNLMYNVQQSPQEQSIVQPQPEQILPTEQGILTYSIVQPSIIPSNILSPPLFNASNPQISICRADHMTVEQTANWVSTFGRYQGWPEAEEYGQQFKQNCIHGLLLKTLDHVMLKVNLKVTNYDHRMQLLNTIKWLFAELPLPETTYVIPVSQPVTTTPTKFLEVPSVSVHDCKRSTVESECASQISNFLASSNNSVRGHFESDSESSYYSHYHASTYNEVETGHTDVMSESGWSNGATIRPTFSWQSRRRSYADILQGADDRVDDGLSMPSMTAGRKSHQFVSCDQKMGDVVMTDQREDTLSIRSVRRARYKRLILRLHPDQIVQGERAIDSINRRLMEFNHVADIRPMQGTVNTYILTFSGSEMAQDAFHQGEEMGYKFEKKWPPRPNPKRPIRFISKVAQQILSGKAFSGEDRGTLRAGEIVVVNQVKGRRARFIKTVGGEDKTIGWVSIHTQEGVPLLEQLDEV